MLHIILPTNQLTLILIAIVIANTAFFFVSIYRTFIIAAKEHKDDEVFDPDRIIHASKTRIKHTLKRWITYCLVTSVATFILFDISIALVTFTCSIFTTAAISGLIILAVVNSNK